VETGACADHRPAATGRCAANARPAGDKRGIEYLLLPVCAGILREAEVRPVECDQTLCSTFADHGSVRAVIWLEHSSAVGSGGNSERRILQ
jgi:hypothetical protein